MKACAHYSRQADEPIASLKEFFADFRPEKAALQRGAAAPATDDELMNMGSQQLLMRLKEAEEKLSLLRYQFDLSKEAASANKPSESPAFARNTLVDAASGELREARDVQMSQMDNGSGDAHETRILNFLLRQYLLAQGYKMTAVTLAEEMTGSSPVSAWSQVGLDLPEPPKLGQMLRYYYSAGAQRVALEIAKEPTLVARLEEKTAEAEKLANELNDARRELAMAQKRAEHLEAEKKRMISVWEHDVEEARRVAKKEALEAMASIAAPSSETAPVAWGSDTASEAGSGNAADADSVTVSSAVSPERAMSPTSSALQPVDDLDFLFARRQFARQAFSSEGLNEGTNARIRQQIRILGTLRLDDLHGLVQVYANCLPNIVPGIILRAREEIVPVLLGTIQQVEDEKTRGQLTSLLFGLVKKPDVAQRHTILQACKVLAELIGRERTERELVPQCWDGMNDKAEERRLLTADFCGVLMAHVRDSRRIPLMLNVLRGLLEDPSPAVRACAAKNVGLLITFTTDVGENFAEMLGHVKRMLLDVDENVGKVALSDVLPKMADWAAADMKLESALINPLLRDMEQHLAQGLGDRTSLRRLAMMADALSVVFPFLRKGVLSWAPFASEVLRCGREDSKRFLLSSEDENTLQERLREFLRHEKDMAFAADDLQWSQVQYITRDLAPALVAMIGSVSLAERRTSYLSLVAVIDAFWKTFDTAATLAFLGPAFCKAIESNPGNVGNLLPAYVAGVLVRGPQPELQAYLSAAIANCVDQDGMIALRSAFELLGSRTPLALEAVLAMLRELVIAPQTRTREVTAFLLDRLATVCSEALVRQTILPAVATLSNDAELVVRLRVVQVLGSVMSSSSEQKVLEPVSFQLDSLLDANVPDVLEAVMMMLTEVCNNVDSGFRDHFLLAKIRRTAELNAGQEDAEERARVAGSIFMAYKVFLECGPSIDTLKTEVLPGLEVLQKQLVLEEHLKSIAIAIVTIRTKAGIMVPNHADIATSNSADVAVPAASVSLPLAEKKEDALVAKAKNMFERFKFGKKSDEKQAPKSDNEK